MLILSRLFYYFYFLRTPKRTTPSDPNFFISPANWRVVSIIYTDTDMINIEKDHKNALQLFTADMEWPFTVISIMLTPLDVHFQKSPCTCTFLSSVYQPGKFINAVSKAENLNATFNNENMQSLFQTTHGYKFKIVQIAWFIARRIVSFCEAWSQYTPGEPIWLIKLGSQVTVVFDKNITCCTAVGVYLIDLESVIWTMS